MLSVARFFPHTGSLTVEVFKAQGARGDEWMMTGEMRLGP